MAYIDEFGCEYSDDKKEFVSCPNNYKGHYTIQEGVTSIGSYAFKDCGGLTSIVVESGNTTYDSRNNCNAIIETATNTLIVGCQATIIPNSVTSISSSAFSGCRGLTSITIGNSVTSIGRYAFRGCSSLTSVTIGNSVTSIEYEAFALASKLAKITVNAVTPPAIEPQTFAEVDRTIPVVVPVGSLSQYKADIYWKEFINISEALAAY